MSQCSFPSAPSELVISMTRDGSIAIPGAGSETGTMDVGIGVGAGLSYGIPSIQTAPKGMEAGPEAIAKGTDALVNYFTAVQQYKGQPPMSEFRQSVQAYSSTVDSSLSAIQGIQAPASEQPADEPAAEPQTEPPADNPPSL